MAAVYTFSDLYQQVLDNLDESDDVSTTRSLAKNFINQAQLMRLTERDWPMMLWPTIETIALVSGQALYPLHEEYWRPFYVFNQTTNTYLKELPERQLLESNARPSSDTGRTEFYRNAGYACVRYQPTSASVVTIVSTNAGDTGASQVVTVFGETSAGLMASEAITPTGTTPAAGTTSFSKILGVTKGAAWTGTMTMTTNSAAITNLVLGPAEYGRVFPQLQLMASPTSADVLEYRFWRQPPKLVNANDIPLIPPPHSQILVWDALMLFAGYLTDISEKSLAVWRNMQQTLERNMQHALQEGMGVNSRPRTVHYVADEYENMPQVYSS